MPGIVGRLFGRWAEPIGVIPIPAGLLLPLQVVAFVVRLYVAGLIGFLLGLIALKNLGILTNDGFVAYGYDKLLGGNKVFGMDADFFRALNIPLPELTQVLIGSLELLGGLALLLGLLTRVFAFFLTGNMLVAMLTFGNIPAELPLFLSCALLVLLGGGILSLDQLLDRQLAARRGPAPPPPSRR
ncbi:MAG TPA: DoxX family membrane protein [Chloroflexia bacterium]|nr:DoxX family membrane protein [Chloroflexia bacterium]